MWPGSGHGLLCHLPQLAPCTMGLGSWLLPLSQGVNSPHPIQEGRDQEAILGLSWSPVTDGAAACMPRPLKYPKTHGGLTVLGRVLSAVHAAVKKTDYTFLHGGKQIIL